MQVFVKKMDKMTKYKNENFNRKPMKLAHHIYYSKTIILQMIRLKI